MKKPRIDAFMEQQKVKSLASPLDDMPVIKPPRTDQTPVEPNDDRTAVPDASVLPPTEARAPAAADYSAGLTDMPYRKDSCLLQPEEFNALDELKVALRKKFNGTITKESLTRCAIRFMLDDYQHNGDNSPVLLPLKKLIKEW